MSARTGHSSDVYLALREIKHAVMSLKRLTLRMDLSVTPPVSTWEVLARL